MSQKLLYSRLTFKYKTGLRMFDSLVLNVMASIGAYQHVSKGATLG
jgi:hypothetical protein